MSADEPRKPDTFGAYLGSLDFKRLVAGQAVASSSESALLHAFELMTTRMQVKGDYRLSALRKEVNAVHADGGVRSFYRGYGFAVLMNVPIELIYRTTYDYNCRSLGRSPFLAGFFADTLISVFQVPTEVITQRLQISPRGTSAATVIKDLYKSDGLRGFYRTLNIALLVHPFQAGAWWYVYEATRRRTEGSVLLSSAAASIVVSAMFNPVQVVKTQLQTGQTRFTGPQLFAQVVKTRKGRMTLATAGLATAMTRAVFEGFIHAFTYETVFDFAKHKN